MAMDVSCIFLVFKLINVSAVPFASRPHQLLKKHTFARAYFCGGEVMKFYNNISFDGRTRVFHESDTIKKHNTCMQHTYIINCLYAVL